MVPLCQFFVGLCWRKKTARDCSGFCKRWQHKWFLSVGSSWDYAGGIMNWLGTMPGKTIKWLGVIVVPLGQFFVGLGWPKKCSRLSWLL